ncbi:MAG: hypothetical protein CVU41_19135, partial [Chloroflexi bacterium HGW-Chloroflexi-3]
SLVSPHASTPPAAPVRPYLSQENQVGERVRLIAPSPSQAIEQVAAGNAAGITPLAVTPAAQNTSAGYPQPVIETQVDVGVLRQQLQQQIGSQFPALDKALLSEIIERVLRRFGIV